MFLFVINKRIHKVLSESNRCSFRGALCKSMWIKVMPGRIPGDFLKLSLTFQIESNLRMIHLTAREKTLTKSVHEKE